MSEAAHFLMYKKKKTNLAMAGLQIQVVTLTDKVPLLRNAHSGGDVSISPPCKRKLRYAILLCSKPFLFLLQPNNEGVRTQAGGVCLDRSSPLACGRGCCLLSGSSCAVFPLARAPPRLITARLKARIPGRIRALHPLPSMKESCQHKKGKGCS